MRGGRWGGMVVEKNRRAPTNRTHHEKPENTEKLGKEYKDLEKRICLPATQSAETEL